MPQINRDNHTVGYGVDGSGPALLAFHGTTQARNAWDQVRAASTVERTWVAIDFPGSGESSMPEGPMDLDEIVADALAVMDHLGVESFDVVGYSLGAVVALHMAGTEAERVRSVTSLCGWSVTDARMRLTFDLWRRLIAIGPDMFMRYALVDGLTAAGLEAIEPMVDVAVAMASGAVAPGSDAHLELDSRIDIASSLEGIAAPCLVIGGIEDRWVDFSKSRTIAAAVRGANLVELPAGHLVITELAGDVARHLDAHLAAS